MKTLEKQLAVKGERVWQDFCLIYPSLVRYNPPKIVLNNRFSRCAGMCRVEENIVQLGTKFFANNSNMMFAVILPHEFAHQIDYIFNKYNDRFHHGKAWKEIMVNYGLPADVYHTMKV